MKTTITASRSWPLLLLAAPAAVAIWSGWVGLGKMSGFGIVHPLPGIADEFSLDSSITLPIGVEAYSAYALGTWLSARPMPARARRFAAWSSLIALGLGLLGQVIYHLLISAGHHEAPMWVVVFVACLPVLVLGAGATLHHLLSEAPSSDQAHSDASTAAAAAVSATAQIATPGIELASEAAVKEMAAAEETGTGDGIGSVTVDVSDLLEPGRAVAVQLDAGGEKLTRRALVEGLRQQGLSCGTDRATALLAALRGERADHIGHLEVVG